MDERAYYSESQTTKLAVSNCPYCRSAETYELRWMVRKKKDRLPPGADERLPGEVRKGAELYGASG